jgi:hypothetical protein
MQVVSSVIQEAVAVELPGPQEVAAATAVAVAGDNKSERRKAKSERED